MNSNARENLHSTSWEPLRQERVSSVGKVQHSEYTRCLQLILEKLFETILCSSGLGSTELLRT
jgi:hypothetical protein